jgi:hypothetical protein
VPSAPSRRAASHASPQFQGPKANKRTITYSHNDGKNVLNLSDDFVVPDTPDPHWQVVDSEGNVYLLDKLKTKAFIGTNYKSESPALSAHPFGSPSALAVVGSMTSILIR